MSFRVEITTNFKKQVKRLLKKYPSLKSELSDLVGSLEVQPVRGVSIGNHCYKIRLAIASKNKGKSGSARVIIHVQFVAELVYLLSIFDKSEEESLTPKEIRDLLKFLPENY